MCLGLNRPWSPTRILFFLANIRQKWITYNPICIKPRNEDQLIVIFEIHRCFSIQIIGRFKRITWCHIRIRLNSSYVRLAHRMFRDNNSSDRNFDIPTEVYLRRKELLDDIHRTIEILEPGLSRRRGTILKRFSFFKANPS